MTDAEKIRAALDAEFPGAEPPPELWERIRAATPALRPGGSARRRWRRLSQALVWGVITLAAGGVALAEAPQVKAVVDRMLGRTGIKLVEFTPEVQQQWAADGAKTTTFAPTVPAEVRQKMPPAMKLPAYLPEVLTRPDAVVTSAAESTWAAVTWRTADQSVLVSWHSYVFGPGSREGTDGPVQETRELKVSGLEANAFLDNSGWTLMWAMDQYQYMVKARGFALEEAVKVAESLK